MAASTSGPSNGASARHGAAAHRRFVVAGGEDHRQRIRVAEGTERRDRRFARRTRRWSRTTPASRATAAGSDGHVTELTDCPRRRFHDGDVGIVEQVEHGRDDRGVSGHRRRELGDAAAHRRRGHRYVHRPTR